MRRAAHAPRPIQFARPAVGGLSAIVFVDGGAVRVKNATAGQLARQDAWSAGVGLRWTIARSFQLSVDAAQVIDGTTASESGDRRIHASLIYRF